MKRHPLSPCLAAVSAAALAAAATVPASATPARTGLSCASRITVLFWPHGNGRMAPLGQPQVAEPHVAVYSGFVQSYPLERFLGWTAAGRPGVPWSTVKPSCVGYASLGPLHAIASPVTTTQPTRLVCALPRSVVIRTETSRDGYRLSVIVRPATLVAEATLRAHGSTLSYTTRGCRQTALPAAAARNGRIAFRRYLDVERTTSAIFTINPDGSGERQLTRPDTGVDDRRPDWSPDGARIAFERKIPCPAGGPSDGLNNTCDLAYTMTAAGTALKPLVPCRFHVSPDYSNGTPEVDCVGVDDPAWSPKGSRIAFQYNLVDRAYTGSLTLEAGIWTANLDGSGLRQLTQRSPGSAWDFGPSWSPDGRTLAFVRADLAAGAEAIFIVDADGSGERQLTPWELGGGDRTQWSSDGRWILFRVQSPDGASNVYEVHPDGTGLTNLTNQGPDGYHYLSSAFSPDGTLIVTARTPGFGAEGAADLYVINADGTNPRAVAQTRLWESAADWGCAPH